MGDIFSRPISVGPQRGPARRPCPQLSVSAGPVRHPHWRERVRRELLHLLRDFSQLAILRHMSGNSADISKGYFEKPIGSLNPLWSASKSLI
jgi:hypothetical protein